MTAKTVPLVDRSDFRRALSADFQLQPRSTTVLAIDLHRGHLDPAIASSTLTRNWGSSGLDGQQLNTDRVHGD